MIDLMLGSPAFPLRPPRLEEGIFVEDVAAIFWPLPEGFPACSINRLQPTQLSELLRELRDFR
jgi:hypothetical protein